jgi:oligoendopeptidase F
MADASFLRQEVLRLDDQALAAAVKAQPALAAYRPYLDELRRRRSRLLGPEAERVLSLAGDNLWAEIDLNELPGDHEKSFHALLGAIPLPTITDEGGKPVQLTFSNYPKYRGSADRRVRAEAVEKLYATLRQYQGAFASSLSGQVNQSVFFARARGYQTALDAYLDKDAIAPAVYRNLVATARANVAPLHRYVALRKRLLGLPELHGYDLYPPMVAGVARTFTWTDAKAILPVALAPLGPEYLKVLATALQDGSGWIDLYPHQGKPSGAFSSSVYGVHPFVKMNYLDDHDGLSTLAHELGHALHSDLAMKHQPYSTSNYAAFIAEIASTFNEKLLSDHLKKTARTREEKLAVLTKLVESIRTTVFRQALFAEFELALHTAAEAGTPLTAELLNKTYVELVRAYYGDALTIGPNDEVEWAAVPHFYYKYYVYAYATGLSSGIALAEKVQTGDLKARDAYLGMLAGGSSKAPLELLKGAGVDLTKPDAIEAAARLMDRTVGELEALLATPAR